MGPLDATWRTSSRSGDNGACVEVRAAGAVEVRDSKDRTGPVLRFDATEWAAFVDGAAAGEFDL